jgi:hypothetical protein
LAGAGAADGAPDLAALRAAIAALQPAESWSAWVVMHSRIWLRSTSAQNCWMSAAQASRMEGPRGELPLPAGLQAKAPAAMARTAQAVTMDFMGFLTFFDWV